MVPRGRPCPRGLRTNWIWTRQAGATGGDKNTFLLGSSKTKRNLVSLSVREEGSSRPAAGEDRAGAWTLMCLVSGGGCLSKQ